MLEKTKKSSAKQKHVLSKSRFSELNLSPKTAVRIIAKAKVLGYKLSSANSAMLAG